LPYNSYMMSIDSVTYRTVNFELRKPWYLNYLKFVFDADTEPIKINRSEALGQFLFSRVRFKNFPVHLEKDRTYVKLIMPSFGTDSGRYKFMYYSDEDVARISDAIESLAYMDSRSMIYTGNIDLGMNKKTIISLFTMLIYGDEKYEAVKKDEYRKRKKSVSWLLKSAKEFGYI